MATVTESFKKDLEALDDDSEDDEIDLPDANKEQNGVSDVDNREIKPKDYHDTKNIEQEERKVNDLEKILSLRSSAKFKNVIDKINSYQNNSERKNLSHKDVYDLVMQTNSLIFDLDRKMFEIYKNVIDVYGKKFPELPSLVQDSFQYIRVVKLIGNKEVVDSQVFKGVIPNALVMSICVSFSNTTGKDLISEELSYVYKACDEVLELNTTKSDILLPYVSNEIVKIAPNLSALVGPEISAILLGLSGGLENLVKIPASNVLVLGKSDAVVSGFSRVNAMRNTGVLYHCSLVQNTEHKHRKKAMRTVSGRLCLCARLDLSLTTSSKNSREYAEFGEGQRGQLWHDEIRQKSEKWAMPNPGKTKQALPDPEPRKRTRRGGRRLRKRKERMAQTEMHRQLNRMAFAENGDDYGDSSMGNDLGMLGSSAGIKHNKFGKLRVIASARKEQAKASKYEQDARNGKLNLARQYKEQLRGINASTGGTITSGLSHSVAMTPVQGIELVNPDLQKQKVAEANAKWFGKKFKFDSNRLKE